MKKKNKSKYLKIALDIAKEELSDEEAKAIVNVLKSLFRKVTINN